MVLLTTSEADRQREPSGPLPLVVGSVPAWSGFTLLRLPPSVPDGPFSKVFSEYDDCAI